MKALDLQGQVIGKLTVIEKAPNSASGRTQWLCRCECGVEKVIPTAYLTGSRPTRSCGCLKAQYKDILGQRFGRLTVIEKTEKRIDRNIVWRCRCDCGTEIEVKSSSLRSGHTQSCGCLQKDRTKEASQKDITNSRFGLLVALEPTDSRNAAGAIIWRCKCDCGKEVMVSSTALRSLHTLSCGCMAESKGELKIKEILSASQIPFEREKSFTTCIFPWSQGIARFDFYVNEEYLIEFDGEQHFNLCGGFFSTEDNLEMTQKRDEYKNQWCKENNIPLIRIPYTHLKDLTVKDLLLETSQFIV